MYESGELAALLGVEQPDDVQVPEPDVQQSQAPIGLENRLN